MRNFWNKCASIVILQFVLASVGLPNTLTVDEAGNVLAETDRYQVRFKEGMLIHFHNKLTQETYTLPPPQGHSNKGRSGIAMQHEEGHSGKPQAINKAWEVETQRLSPLSVEIAYHYDFILDKTVRFRISIDVNTGISLFSSTAFQKMLYGLHGCVDTSIAKKLT